MPAAAAPAPAVSPASLLRCVWSGGRDDGGHAGCINCAAWSPRGDALVTGSDDRLVKVDLMGLGGWKGGGCLG